MKKIITSVAFSILFMISFAVSKVAVNAETVSTVTDSKNCISCDSDFFGTFHELKEGDSVSLDIDSDGEDDIIISCTRLTVDSSRGNTQYAYADLDIKVKYLGITYTAATANMTLRYYSDGINGYVESLYGTASAKGLFSVDWDPTQITYPAQHALFLNIHLLGTNWQVMIVGNYDPFSGTGEIGVA